MPICHPVSDRVSAFTASIRPFYGGKIAHRLDREALERDTEHEREHKIET
jgi:hypothetical protein